VEEAIMPGYSFFLIKSIQAALEAGEAIEEIYQSDFAVEYKEDNSPLTRADRKSHELLVASLSRFKIPVLSEEGREIPYAERKTWERLWIIDPLDGTKEFIKRNGEFTVNIALVDYFKPVLGVVYAPVHDIVYFAAKGIGSYKIERPDVRQLSMKNPLEGEDEVMENLIQRAQRLPADRPKDMPFTIAGSRSHAGPELKKFVEEKRREHGEVEFISTGSSLKICLVAEGTADLYPRLGPTCEWDTAAGQAIAEFAGAKVLNFHTGEPIRYNRDDVLNPWFIVRR
jgi:3'(2'), 5'-bisphosphate nucleotidase